MRSLEDTRALIKMAKEMGVRVLKLDGFEVVLDPPEQAFDPNALKDPMMKPWTEDDVRFAAVGGSGALDSAGNPVEDVMGGMEDGN